MYTIYGLEDPLDNKIYYVGMTSQFKKRMYIHCSARDISTADWVKEMKDEGRAPNCLVLENSIKDKSAARDRENYWIGKHHSKNGNILNVRGVKHLHPVYTTIAVHDHLHREVKQLAISRKETMIAITEAMITSHIALANANIRLSDCMVSFLNLIDASRKTMNRPDAPFSDVVEFLIRLVGGSAATRGPTKNFEEWAKLDTEMTERNTTQSDIRQMQKLETEIRKITNNSKMPLSDIVDYVLLLAEDTNNDT